MLLNQVQHCWCPSGKLANPKAKTQPPSHSGTIFTWLKQERSQHVLLIILNVSDGLNCKRVLSTYDHLLNGNRPKSTLWGAQISEQNAGDRIMQSSPDPDQLQPVTGSDYILKECFYINWLHFSSLYSTDLAARRNPQANCMLCKSSHVMQHQHKRTNRATRVSKEEGNTNRKYQRKYESEKRCFTSAAIKRDMNMDMKTEL